MYKDSHGNSRPRLSDEKQNLLALATRIGFERLNTVLEPEYVSLDIADGENETESPLQLQERTIGIIGDVHIGFHDKRALELSLTAIKHFNIDALILNGDILDFYALSRFDKNPNRVSIAYEIKLARSFFAQLRTILPKANIYFKKGNHEERYDKWFALNAKEALGLDEFNLDKILQLDNFGIIPISDKRLIRAGDLNILHGHELLCGGEYVAARVLNKFNENIVFNHYHRINYAQKRSINGVMIKANALGCLCKLNPHYFPYNQWQHGYGLAEIYNGISSVQNKAV